MCVQCYLKCARRSTEDVKMCFYIYILTLLLFAQLNSVSCNTRDDDIIATRIKEDIILKQSTQTNAVIPINTMYKDDDVSENVIKVKLRADDNPASNSKPISYKFGNKLTVECLGSETNNNITWHAVNADQTSYLEFIPPCYRPSCALEMTLTLFDNNTTIFCMNVDKVSSLLHLLYKDAESSQDPTENTEIRKDNGKDQIIFNCSGGMGQYVTQLLDNRRISYTLNLYKFHMNESLDGLRMACINYSTSDTPVYKTTRNIYNHVLFSYSKQSSEERPTNLPIILAPAILGSILIIIVVIIILKRRQPKKQSHEVDTYACINRVEYADLELLQTNSRTIIKSNETSPYAEVIGVLTPKNI